MPTPSDSAPQVIATAVVAPDDLLVNNRATCPPEFDRLLSTWSESADTSSGTGTATLSDADGEGHHNDARSGLSRSSSAPSSVVTTIDDGMSRISSAPSSVVTTIDDGMSRIQDVGIKADSPTTIRDMRRMDDEAVGGGGRLLSPAEASRSPNQSSAVNSPASSSLMSYEFSNVRLLPNHTSSFLRAGSKFVGTQQSDRQVYNVDVEIKHVDIAESYLCGYLRIQGLTEDHPTLTTFFEGEIIGTKHTFQTRNEAWGATPKTDMNHWSRFPAWRPLSKQSKRPDFTYRNFAQREHIFMRWKEYFLVPDHRVRTISGASFEGFYYICFNQVEGTVSGVYFHAKSERFQQLELKHVDDHGCAPAIEFR